MRSAPGTPIPSVKCRGKSPSPTRWGSKTKTRNHYSYSVPMSLKVLLIVLVCSDIFVLSFSCKTPSFFILFIFFVLATIYVYHEIDKEALFQAKEIKKKMTNDQITSILKSPENPCIDSHVRTKLIELVKLDDDE